MEFLERLDLGTILFIVFMLTSILGPALKRKANPTPPRPSGGGRAAQRTELEERVRRNFEEMMKRRSRGGAPANDPATPPVAAPRPASPMDLVEEILLPRPPAPAPRPVPAPMPAPSPQPAQTPQPARATHPQDITRRLVEEAPAPPAPHFEHTEKVVDRSWTTPHQRAPDSPWRDAHAYDIDPGARLANQRKSTLQSLRKRGGVKTAMILMEILDVPVAFREETRRRR